MARRRSTVLALLATIGLALGVVSVPSPAAADPIDPLTATVDRTVTHPGETVTLTVHLTNPEDEDIVFSYLSVIPMIWTEGNTVDFAFTGCTGDVTWCGIWDAPHHGVSLHPTVAIAPGASRTVALTYHVASYTVCVVPANMRFYLYEYHETATGSAELFEFEAQMTNVEC